MIHYCMSEIVPIIYLHVSNSWKIRIFGNSELSIYIQNIVAW